MKGKFHIRLPIAYTLMLYIFLLVSLAVGMSTYFAVKQESKVLTKNLIHLSEHIASNIAVSAESAFWSLNWVFVEKLLKEVVKKSQNKEILFVKMVKPDGEVYLADDKACYGEKVAPSLLVNKKTLFHNYTFPVKQEKGFLLVYPVTI